MRHLWEVDHPYYCAEANWYSNEAYLRYDSWAYFIEDWGDLDLDLNHVFRWDWHEPDEDNTHGRLQIFVMLQRKGLFKPIDVFGVTPEDEPSVRAWLERHWDKIGEMWAPIADLP